MLEPRFICTYVKKLVMHIIYNVSLTRIKIQINICNRIFIIIMMSVLVVYTKYFTSK